MSSEVRGEDNSILFSIACHQGIEAVSGPKLIANCFWPFSELFFGGMSATHIGPS